METTCELGVCVGDMSPTHRPDPRPPLASQALKLSAAVTLKISLSPIVQLAAEAEFDHKAPPGAQYGPSVAEMSSRK